MQHAVLEHEGRVAAAARSFSLEWWCHRCSVCVVVVEDRVDSEKPGSGCNDEYRSRHAEENWRAEEAFVSDCVTHEHVLVDVADDYDYDSGETGGLETFQRCLATLHTARGRIVS